MLICNNPTTDKINELCAASEHNAAKWVRDKETGEYWYWIAEQCTHAQMAQVLHIADYEKGIAVPT